MAAALGPVPAADLAPALGQLAQTSAASARDDDFYAVIVAHVVQVLQAVGPLLALGRPEPADWAAAAPGPAVDLSGLLQA